MTRARRNGIDLMSEVCIKRLRVSVQDTGAIGEVSRASVQQYEHISQKSNLAEVSGSACRPNFISSISVDFSAWYGSTSELQVLVECLVDCYNDSPFSSAIQFHPNQQFCKNKQE